MKNLLIGNGVNINFSGTSFTNGSIIRRAITNTKRKKSELDYSKETVDLLNYLYIEAKLTILGLNDQYVFTSYDKETLINFKKKYKGKVDLKITDIGLEDYFFLYEVFCSKKNIKNPEHYNIRELLNRMFLDSIYFNGAINKIWKCYPKFFVHYLNSFDNIFTTNYDNNVEMCIKKPVMHLHGSFFEFDEKYNPNSLRNKLSDMKNVDYSYTKNHPYLYSTALFAYCGEMKEFSTSQHRKTNTAIEKFASGFNEKKEDPKKLEEWISDDNQMIKNLGEAIKLKQEHPEYKVNEPYHIQEFLEICDELEILGLSPSNDDHIFRWIKENSKVQQIKYYYYENSEIQKVRDLIGSSEIIFENVKDFWKQ